MYQDEEGIPLATQRFVHGGKVLSDDGRTLLECGVEEGSVVFMVQRCACCGKK